MSIKIEATGTDYTDALHSLNAVPLSQHEGALRSLGEAVAERDEALKDYNQTRLALDEATRGNDRLIKSMNEIRQDRDDLLKTNHANEAATAVLQSQYDACVEVRNSTALDLSAAVAKYEALEESYRETQRQNAFAKKEGYDKGYKLGHEQGKRDALEQYDPGPDEQNKTLFNVTDLQRHKKDALDTGYASGYEKGKADQQAEHAQEKACYRWELVELLQVGKVRMDIYGDANKTTMTRISFDPTHIVCVGATHNGIRQRMGRGQVEPGTLAIVGTSMLSGAVHVYTRDEIARWKAGAVAPEPENG